MQSSSFVSWCCCHLSHGNAFCMLPMNGEGWTEMGYYP